MCLLWYRQSSASTGTVPSVSSWTRPRSSPPPAGTARPIGSNSVPAAASPRSRSIEAELSLRQGRYLLGRLRAGEQVTLGPLAAERAQPVDLTLVVDAFG